ncbi:MAG: hypothetical protein IJ002_08000 [Clostridia bacterium]|nr:hypothetical protein [Clostridia bacterium]
MRNLKKFLALVLATMMLLSVAVISTSAASTDADYTEAAQRLAALQVMKGNENGDLMLDNGVTRYQAALFFVQALTGETETATWNSTKNSAYFGDVVEYGTAIDYAYGIGLILGRGNGVYGYNDAILYQDMLVMAVRALGYETDDMSYPYGYILAAQKLGLTENVALVDYKAALTRGETAQIIWDMLDTEVAVTDPITDKILYPGEVGLTDVLLGQNGETVTERETLMESSDLAGDKITAYVVEFTEADEDDEDSVDTVTLVSGDLDEVVEIAAADLGITVDTPAVSYMGLALEVYIDVDAADFDQAAYDDGDAALVFATQPTYEAVLNLGDGNVKFVANENDGSKSYFNFNGTKLAVGKYVLSVAVFVDGIWTWNEDVTEETLADIFAYDDDEYVNTYNQYASISYNVTDTTLVDEEGNEYTLVDVLYTPLSFGQYNVREVNDTEYTVIGVYNSTTKENLDEEDSYFWEYLLAETGLSSTYITSSTKNISKTKGELSQTVTLAGAPVEAGDFMFYAYNGTDNILTVAMNCGTFETGRLTAKNTSKETVKIGGTNYEFGFAAGVATSMPSAWDNYAADLQTTYIGALEAGKDNVKYLLVDGKIVYMEPASETTNNSVYDFAVITIDAEIMADLLDMSDAKYANALVGVTDAEAGVYVDDNGYMAVAMMNKTTGEWELASVKAVELDYDAEEDEFDTTADPATLASYVDMFNSPSDYNKYGNYAAAMDVVNEVVVAVVDEDDGVYTIASNAYGEDDSFFVTGTTTEGILFSDNNAKTNALTADDEIDAERVTVNADTVIIVIDEEGNVGSRVGVQGADNSFVGEGKVLAASSDLIVLWATTSTTDVLDWNDAATSSSDETWYITTVDTGVELENTSDDDDAVYVVTITNVINLKTLEVVDAITCEVEESDDPLTTIEGAGTVIYQKGETIEEAEETLIEALEACADANEDKIDYVAVDVDDIDFVNADTITVAELIGEDGMTAGEAVDVNVKVITVNNVVDADDYDFSNVVLNELYDEEADEDSIGSTMITLGDAKVEYWFYEIDGELVEEITEPTDGIFDNWVIANNGAEILVPEAGAKNFDDAITCTVDLEAVAAYEDGVVYITVYKTINQVVVAD